MNLTNDDDLNAVNSLLNSLWQAFTNIFMLNLTVGVEMLNELPTATLPNISMLGLTVGVGYCYRNFKRAPRVYRMLKNI